MRLSNAAKMIRAILALLTGLGMIGVAWWQTRPVEESAAYQKRQAEALQHRRDLLSTQVGILVSVEEEANRAAMIRAENDLLDTFRTYADRTPQLAESATGWKARFKLAFLRFTDWWSATNTVQQLTAELFAQHVVSDVQSVKDLTRITSQFRSDLEANRNRTLTEAALRIRQADLGMPDLRLSQEDLVARLFATEQEALSRTLGTSPWNALLSFGGSAIGGGAMELLVVQMIRIASAGMVPGAITGGQTGSFVAPGVGTVVGAFVGFAIGIAIDYWMTKRMTIAIEEEARRTLNAIRETIWSDPSLGLKVKFDRLINLTRDTHERVLRNMVSGGAS